MSLTSSWVTHTDMVVYVDYVWSLHFRETLTLPKQDSKLQPEAVQSREEDVSVNILGYSLSIHVLHTHESTSAVL